MYSIYSTVQKELLELPKKNERITSTHILALLKENQGTGMRYTDIYQAMRKKSYRHNFTSTIDNLRFLVKHKKIVKVLTCYGIPVERENGSKYLIIKSSGQKVTVNIE